MKKIVLPLLLGLISQAAVAQVWTDTQSWSEEWEEKYAGFVKSSRVHEGIFTHSSSPYAGIKADCAHAAYALRVIFSYENGLPFAIRNPSGARPGQPAYVNFHNRISRFDYIRDEKERVIAFINYIGSSVGSENLTRNDTFPVAINALQSGDLFTYRITRSFRRLFRTENQYIRHVYNIKGINPTGTFDVIYSTQAIAEAGLPLIRRRERMFSQLPNDAWGFRRFRWPEYIGQPVSAIPQSLGRSNEQYQMVEQYGDAFFRQVSTRLATIEENPNQRLRRSLNNLCIEAQGRVDNINQGLDYLQRIGGRCMDYQEYDAYSTPARDEALNQTYLRLNDEYRALSSEGLLGRVNAQTMAFTRAILFNESGSAAELRQFCPITYRAGVTIDLAELRRRQNAGRLSSHPNDDVFNRWGEPGAGRTTRCRQWY